MGPRIWRREFSNVIFRFYFSLSQIFLNGNFLTLSLDFQFSFSDFSKWPAAGGASLICEFTITSNFSLFPDSNSSAIQFDLNVNNTFIIMAQGLLGDNGTLK